MFIVRLRHSNYVASTCFGKLCDEDEYLPQAPHALAPQAPRAQAQFLDFSRRCKSYWKCRFLGPLSVYLRETYRNKIEWEVKKRYKQKTFWGSPRRVLQHVERFINILGFSTPCFATRQTFHVGVLQAVCILIGDFVLFCIVFHYVWFAALVWL